MLTPAEELGLSGMNLAGRIRSALHKIPDAEMLALLQRIEREAARRHLVYLRDGKTDTIRVLACPLDRPAGPAGLHPLRHADHSERPETAAGNVFPGLRRARAAAHACRKRRSGCGSAGGRATATHNPVFGRLDAVVDFTSPMWKDSLRFVEPNLSGIGGLHLMPTCERIVADVVLPALTRARRRPAAGGRPGHPRAAHARGAGPPGGRRPARPATSASSSRSTPAAAPTSRRTWPGIYHDRYGLKIMHADPAELTLRGDEVYYDGDRGRSGVSRLRRGRPDRPGARRAWTWSRCGRCSGRTASFPRSRRNWIRKVAGRC